MTRLDRLERLAAERQQDHIAILSSMRDQINSHLQLPRDRDGRARMTANRDALNWAIDRIGGTL